MFAFQPAPIVHPATSDAQPDVIEIVGHRAGQALKIDRRTYEVQQTPHSAQKDSLQLLRGLPAVTITPNDQVNLLGATNVTILIDGHATRTDLHTLHGSDIERIEVITNPSSQYSAEGTGGIINIVLRRKQREGLSGNASVEGSSLGQLNGMADFKYKKGKWTYEIAPEGTTGDWRYSTYHKYRAIEDVPGGASTINSEDGGGPSRVHGGDLQLKATYELDPKTSISATAVGGGTRYSSINDAMVTAVTPDFQSFTERQRQSGAANFLAGLLTFDHKGARDGETLKASVNIFGNPYTRDGNLTELGNGGSTLSETRMTTLFSDSKVDWDHPIGQREILSLGAEWFLQQSGHHYHFTSSDPATLGNNAIDDFRGTESTVSAYLTFQQKFGTWTIMPGLRMETNGRRVTSPGLPETRIERTDLFPTLHAEHPLSKAFDLTLSYSKRIDRPQLDQLRPYPVTLDLLTIVKGNPRLSDQSTDAYEINLHYHLKKVDVGLIVYDRQTTNLVSESFSVNGSGQNVETFVNSGRKRDSGAEIDVSTPLLSRIKAITSVNLFDSRVPVDQPGNVISEDQFRFTTNSTLEWDGPDRKGKPGDIAQLVWHYESPATQFQFRNFAWNSLNLSYTHSFSAGLSLTATADSKAIHNGHRLIAPLVQEYYALHDRAAFKLKLMKTFGKP